MGAVAGISAKEALLMAPGEVFDLFELYLRATGAKKKPGPEDE